MILFMLKLDNSPRIEHLLNLKHFLNLEKDQNYIIPMAWSQLNYGGH
jgi:hypothetical protein